MSATKRLLTVGALVGLLTLSACSSNPAPESSGSAQPLTKVTAIMSNPFSVVQYFGYYLLGVQKGFFADEGIDVSFQEGSGSTTSAQAVAAGNAEFGLNIGFVAVVNTDDQGADLKLVARDSAVSAYAVVSLDAAISSPKDLEGKTIGVPQGTTQALLWPGFLEQAGVDATKVNAVNVSPADAVTTLAQGRVDGILTYSTSAVPGLAAIGETDPTVLSLTDYGFTIIPDAGVIATQSLIDSDPDLVKHFVAAVEKSLEYGLEHPDEIYAAGSVDYPDSFNATVVDAQATITEQGFSDYTDDGKAYTYFDPEAVETSLGILRGAGVISTSNAAETYYTNDFVPSGR